MVKFLTTCIVVCRDAAILRRRVATGLSTVINN
jgi:hypothetical protein